MLAHNTNTVIVKRQGSDMLSTNYEFIPQENEPENLFHEMYKKYGQGGANNG